MNSNKFDNYPFLYEIIDNGDRLLETLCYDNNIIFSKKSLSNDIFLYCFNCDKNLKLNIECNYKYIQILNIYFYQNKYKKKSIICNHCNKIFIIPIIEGSALFSDCKQSSKIFELYQNKFKIFKNKYINSKMFQNLFQMITIESYLCDSYVVKYNKIS